MLPPHILDEAASLTLLSLVPFRGCPAL